MALQALIPKEALLPDIDLLRIAQLLREIVPRRFPGNGNRERCIGRQARRRLFAFSTRQNPQQHFPHLALLESVANIPSLQLSLGSLRNLQRMTGLAMLFENDGPHVGASFRAATSGFSFMAR